MAVAFPHFLPSEEPPRAWTSTESTPPVVLSQDELKRIAAYKAVEYVQSGMVLGLGTGSTAKHAVAKIGDLLHQGKLKNIVGVPTSKMTHEQALSLVTGRGGSLLREKMVEGACKKFIVIVDESKLVSHIGATGLAMPVEIVPFCWKFTAERLQELFEYAGCVSKLRTYDHQTCEPFVTDNGNYIVDLYFKSELGDLNVASDKILRLAGVVEHGMFLGMATTLIVAGEVGVCVTEK